MVLICAFVVYADYDCVFSEIRQSDFAEVHRCVPIHIFVYCVHLLHTYICIYSKYVTIKKSMLLFSLCCLILYSPPRVLT